MSYLDVSDEQRAFSRTEGLYQAAKRTAEVYEKAGDEEKAKKYWRIAAQYSEETFNQIKGRADRLNAEENLKNGSK